MADCAIDQNPDPGARRRGALVLGYRWTNSINDPHSCLQAMH
jgi:hypothetical protein